MILFASIAVAMTLAALACVVLPLLKRGPSREVLDTRQTNLEVLRDQIEELKTDLERGAIPPTQFDAASAEVEARVLEEAAPSGLSRPASDYGTRGAAIAFLLAVPIAAASMYFWIGEPGGLDESRVAQVDNLTNADVQQMVTRLADRLQKNPDDGRGWVLLGRSYYVMQRMDDAVAAYAKAVQSIRDDADLFADYADALAMTQGRSLDGKPMELVKRSLAINPLHPKALAMAGTEAFHRKDYRAAISYWEKLVGLVPADSEIGKSIAGGIAEANDLALASSGAKSDSGKSGSAPTKKQAGGPSVSGRVTLSPAIASKADPQETLFVIARATNGPRMPLAVLRKRVSDLPLDFTLDDTMAMSPELKLSGANEVMVTARISKSGNPIAQSGDLQGATPSVRVGARGLRVVIDSVVP